MYRLDIYIKHIFHTMLYVKCRYTLKYVGNMKYIDTSTKRNQDVIPLIEQNF